MINHPSSLLDPEWIRIIRSSASAAERSAKLSDEQLDLIYKQQWFNIYVPREYGGLEKTLPEIVMLEEALSWAEGSVGWTMTLCSGAAWFSGFLEPLVASETFSDPKVCLAGSGASTGTAEITENGYLINGTWRYASGILHATGITANCIITQNKIPCKDQNGNNLILSFIFKKNEVIVLPGWNYNGLKATGSHWYEVKNLEVPSNRSFKIDPDFSVHASPIFKYPFLQLAEATLVANSSGMAIRFIELADVCIHEKTNFNEKQSRYIKELKETLYQSFGEARTRFYTSLQNSWDSLDQTGTIDKHYLQEVSLNSRKLAKASLEMTDSIYPFCGLAAADTTAEINRVWRDIHTASQHSLLTFPFERNI